MNDLIQIKETNGRETVEPKSVSWGTEIRIIDALNNRNP